MALRRLFACEELGRFDTLTGQGVRKIVISSTISSKTAWPDDQRVIEIFTKVTAPLKSFDSAGGKLGDAKYGYFAQFLALINRDCNIGFGVVEPPATRLTSDGFGVRRRGERDQNQRCHDGESHSDLVVSVHSAHAFGLCAGLGLTQLEQ